MSRWDPSTLGKDLLASIVVFLIALPLCMGIAIASGVPPAAGLITGAIGGIIVGALAGAPLQVSGPAAGLTVLVFQFVSEHGLAPLGAVVLLAGLFQLLAGFFKIGQWFRAISPAVIHGMLAGIGVLICASQVHILLDGKPSGSGISNLISIPGAIWAALSAGGPAKIALGVGTGAILLLVLWDRFRPGFLRYVPAALVAVAASTMAVAMLGLPIQRVPIPDGLLGSIQLPALGTLAHIFDHEMFLEALAIAFIASAETLLSAAALDKLHDGPRANYDRELVAQGTGNMLCGLLGGLPMTGVIVRSSANVRAGAKTRLAAILQGLWLVILVVFFAGFLRMIPVCALAAVLVVVGYKLVDPNHIRVLRQAGKGELGIYFATMAGIVLTDLLTGVLIGVGLAIGQLVYRFSHLEIRIEDNPKLGRIDIHLAGASTFVRLPALAAALENLPEGADVRIHLERLTYIDHACFELIADTRDQLEKKGTTLEIEWEELESRFRKPVAEPEPQQAVLQA